MSSHYRVIEVLILVCLMLFGLVFMGGMLAMYENDAYMRYTTTCLHMGGQPERHGFYGFACKLTEK